MPPDDPHTLRTLIDDQDRRIAALEARVQQIFESLPFNGKEIGLQSEQATEEES